MDFEARIGIIFFVSAGVGILASYWKGRNPIVWTLIPFLSGLLFPGLTVLSVLLLAFMSKTAKDTA